MLNLFVGLLVCLFWVGFVLLILFVLVVGFGCVWSGWVGLGVFCVFCLLICFGFEVLLGFGVVWVYVGWVADLLFCWLIYFGGGLVGGFCGLVGFLFILFFWCAFITWLFGFVFGLVFGVEFLRGLGGACGFAC